jgi:hypothetical protein
MPDCVGLVLYRTGPSIVSFFIPVRYWTDRMPDSPVFRHLYTCMRTNTQQTHTSGMDMDMTCSRDIEMKMQKVY